jgi:capsular exopolysaccharide synthesis family protein
MNAFDVLNREGPISNEIRKLESRLWRRTRKDGLKVLMFSSALQGEGKSTTVALFAAATALHRARRVLVVDLDFRSPNLHRYLGVSESRSFLDYLAGKGSLDDCSQATQAENLELIAGAPSDLDPDLLLNSSELSDALDVFREKYDLVILDVPPLIPVADAATLIPHADGILLVVMAGLSSKHHLARARDIVLGMEGNILGLVVGNIQEAAPDYLDRSYYHYQRAPARTEPPAEEVGAEVP